MKIFYHRFSLRPLKKLNHLAGLSDRDGVFLRSESTDGIGYSEYFPHPELGDLNVEEFLDTFKDQMHETQMKALYFLDPQWSQVKTGKIFYNHQLYREGERLECTTIKYKIKNDQDFFFQHCPEGIKNIRLDANGLFNANTWRDFELRIPKELYHLIEYIEDPLSLINWEDVSLPKAQDFIKGSPCQVKIYKPYREFYPEETKKVIFSGNMGHGLSNYQGYLELLQKGNLEDYHGIITPNLYENSANIFTGNYQGGFAPNTQLLNHYFHELELRPWKRL